VLSQPNKTQGEVEANLNMRDRIKELEEKLTNHLALISLKNKLDIKPIKQEMNKLIELDHEDGKTIKHKDRLIRVKISCNDHKYDIINKSPSLKKGVHLLTMGTFNRFLVLNQFCMDKIKY
jgi:hypothetical protein